MSQETSGASAVVLPQVQPSPEPSSVFTVRCVVLARRIHSSDSLPYPPVQEIRVLVADSNQLQSQVLMSALRRLPSLRVRSCGNRLTHCMEALQFAPADVVVLGDDVSDRENQIRTLRGLRGSSPGIRLIFSVDRYDRNLVVNALLAGANGVFCRADHPFRALCRCIEAVYRGEFWVSNEHLGYVIDALRCGVQRRVVNAKNIGLLTPREEQVADLVAAGSANREVAELLGVKENTIKKSLLRIYDKLGISNRVELVLYVLTHRESSISAEGPAELTHHEGQKLRSA